MSSLLRNSFHEAYSVASGTYRSTDEEDCTPLANCMRMGTVFQVETARLLGGGRIVPNPDWACPWHAHQHWEFIYFLRGCGRVEFPNAFAHPQQYHLLIYPPGLPHAEVADPHDPEETIFFGVDVAGSPPAGAHLLLPDPSGELRWLCERVLGELLLHGSTPLAGAYTHAFLYLLERAWESGTPVRHDAVDVAVQYLHANYASSITLKELAGVTCTSETHLAHRFNARLGISPMRYLQRIRLEVAHRLLLTTTQPVNAVAQQAGFDDPLYFSRVFKQATGQSPAPSANSAWLGDKVDRGVGG